MIKLYFDEKEIEKDYYRSLSQSYILFDKSFCLGSVPSNTFKIELNSQANIDSFNHVRMELDEEDYAHVFYDNIDDSNGSKNIIALSDAMVDFEFDYDASPLINTSDNGYVTILEVLEDICAKKGVTLATKDFNLKDKQITWYDSTITARKYISYIATLNGGFAKINHNGELELVRHTNDIKAIIDTCENYKIGEYHKITRVVWDIGVDKWVYGDETGNTLYLDTDNPFITKKEDVESIYNLINGFEFYSMEIAKCPIDSNIDIGDTIAFKNGDNLYPFIAQLELSYNGGFYGGYKFVVNTEKVEETSVNETQKNIKSIKTRLNRDEAELEIIAEESKETQKNLHDLSNPIITKHGNNHICLDEAYETGALEYNIEGKCEQESEPSPEYPSEVKTIKGIRNLLDLSDFNPSGSEVVVNENSSITVTTGEYDGNVFKIMTELLKGGTYTFTNFSDLGCYVQLDKSDYTHLVKQNNSYTFEYDGTSYLRFIWSVQSKNTTQIYKAQLEEGSVAQSYVPYGSWLKCKITNNEDETLESYQEKEVLVDMNKPNLFDENNIILNKGLNTANGEYYEANDRNSSDFIPIKPFTTYIIKDCHPKAECFYTENKAFISGVSGYESFTSPSNAKYFRFAYDNTKNDNCKVYEGYSPYYELCSIGETKDNLEVVSGHLEKRIGKIVLNGSESWQKDKNNGAYFVTKSSIGVNHQATGLCLCTHYKKGNILTEDNVISLGTNNFIQIQDTQFSSVNEFKIFVKEQYDNGTPVIIYYELAELEEISLTPTEVPLFEGENHIQLEEDIETDTNIKYLKKTAFTDAYQTKVESQAQMRITSEEITNSVSSTRTELKNDLMVTNEKFNNYALQQVVVEQINSVLQKITDSEARINILNQTITNGVPITKTETGYTFDINGLNISSTDAEVNSTLSSIGLSILDNIQKTSLLFAGYDKELQETIVRAQNMIIQKYLIVPHARFERYNNPTFGEGMGCFYVD